MKSWTDFIATQFSPRMRGCFQVITLEKKRLGVLPAYAGMFLSIFAVFGSSAGSPRVCGDVSLFVDFFVLVSGFSPRMRGCFCASFPRLQSYLVLPAYAGMFPTSARKAPRAFCSPRVCGDVSEVKQHADLRSAFSPRMRGCFRQGLSEAKASTVLPAYAGMFPRTRRLNLDCLSSPRVCGDVSRKSMSSASKPLFSPRMRGCFYSLKHGDKTIQVIPAQRR